MARSYFTCLEKKSQLATVRKGATLLHNKHSFSFFIENTYLTKMEFIYRLIFRAVVNMYVWYSVEKGEMAMHRKEGFSRDFLR